LNKKKIEKEVQIFANFFAKKQGLLLLNSTNMLKKRLPKMHRFITLKYYNILKKECHRRKDLFLLKYTN
jgi:hypothetical protein